MFTKNLVNDMFDAMLEDICLLKLDCKIRFMKKY